MSYGVTLNLGRGLPEPQLYLFIDLVHLCVCVWVSQFTSVEVRGQLVKVAFLLLPLGPRDQAQAVRIGGSTFPCGALSMAPELQSHSMENRKTKGVLLSFCQFDTNCSCPGKGNLK